MIKFVKKSLDQINIYFASRVAIILSILNVVGKKIERFLELTKITERTSLFDLRLFRSQASGKARNLYFLNSIK